MKHLLLFTLFTVFFMFSCGSDSDSEPVEEIISEDDTSNYVDESELYTDEVIEEPPFGGIDPNPFQIGDYEIIEIAQGDLDKDGQKETAVAYDTYEGEYESIRCIIIFKEEENGWRIWSRSNTAILEAGSGGVMGNGFDAMEITNGVLDVTHWGGSREKWTYSHKFRYQEGDFYCIGATIGSYEPCVYWDEFDYNLSTGKAYFTVSDDDCENEESSSESKTKIMFDPIDLPRFSEMKIGENEAKDPETGKSYNY